MERIKLNKPVQRIKLGKPIERVKLNKPVQRIKLEKKNYVPIEEIATKYEISLERLIAYSSYILFRNNMKIHTNKAGQHCYDTKELLTFLRETLPNTAKEVEAKGLQ